MANMKLQDYIERERWLIKVIRDLLKYPHRPEAINNALHETTEKGRVRRPTPERKHDVRNDNTSIGV